MRLVLIHPGRILHKPLCHSRIDQEEAVGGVPYDMEVDLDWLFVILESRLNGFWIIEVEQSRKRGSPTRADRLELNRSRLIDQGLHGR